MNYELKKANEKDISMLIDYKLQNNENKMLKREIMTKFEHSIKEISLN